MTIRAFVIPNYLVCGECGFVLQLQTSPRPVPGKTAYKCINSHCKQFNQPHWYRYKEVVLDESV